MRFFKVLAASIILLCAFGTNAAGDPISLSCRHEYRVSALDSGDSARLIALEQAGKILLVEAAGRLSNYGEIRMLRLDRGDLAALVAPLAQIDVTGGELREGGVRVQASLRIEPLDAVRFLNTVVLSPVKAGELREIRKRTDIALVDIDRIGKNRKKPDENGMQAKAAYQRAVEELVLSRHSLKGWGLSWSGRYREAVEEFTQALSRRPDQAETWRQRGVAYLKLKDRERALADLNRALEVNPRYAHAYANRGYLFLESGDPQKAILDFNRALELKRASEDPDPADEHAVAPVPDPSKPDQAGKPATPAGKQPRIEYYRQLAFQRLGPPKSDPAYFTSILEKNPDYAPAWYGRGLVHQSGGRQQQALDDFNRAVRLMPENPAYFHARAGTYTALKRIGEAIEDYSRAITLNSRFARSYYERGLLYFQKGDFRRAAADFARTAELEPGNSKAAGMRDAAMGKLGKKPDVAYLDAAIAENPDRLYAIYQRAIAFWGDGKTGKAIEDCTAVIDLKPDDVRAHLIRGILHGSGGDYRNALNDHNRAFALAPGDLLVFGSRLKAFGGDQATYDKALSEYRKIAKLQPRKAEPALYRGIANFFLGQYEDAMADCGKAAGLDPSFGGAYRWHGTVLHILGNYELALRYYDQALRQDRNDALSHYLRGTALLAAGRTPEAVVSLKEASALGLKAAGEVLKKLKY